MVRVAMLWLVNDKRQVLLARRADHKPADPGLWGPSVTGKLEADETFAQALVLEADEELALKGGDYTPRFLFETDFEHPDGQIRQFQVYAAGITDVVAARLEPDPDEVAEIKWLSLAEVRELIKTKPNQSVVPSAFELWGQIFDALEAPEG